MITLNNGHLLMKLPEWAFNPSISMGELKYWYKDKRERMCVEFIELPPGDYDIKIFEEMTEEECEPFVRHDGLYYDYVLKDWIIDSAKESFRTLIEYHNSNPSETIILIKKQ